MQVQQWCYFGMHHKEVVTIQYHYITTKVGEAADMLHIGGLYATHLCEYRCYLLALGTGLHADSEP